MFSKFLVARRLEVFSKVTMRCDEGERRGPF
jgi:hypothetical protein